MRIVRPAFCGLFVAIAASVPSFAQCWQWSPAFAGDGFDYKPSVLASLDDGSGSALYAGGHFSTAGRTSARYVARWNGSRWQALGAGALDAVLAIEMFDDGSGPALYAGGELGAAPTDLSFVQRWDGTNWTTVETGTGLTVKALARFDDGSGARLYGGFTLHPPGAYLGRVLAFDGANWTQIGGDIPGGYLEALAVHDDGTGPALYAAGGFNVMKLSGGSWTQVGSGVGGTVDDLVSDGNQLYAIGDFVLTNKRGVALWDGATWSSIGFVNNTAAKLFSGAIWNGALHVAGNLAGGVSRYTGSGWLNVGASDDVALALATYDDGSGHGEELYSGGEFHSMAGARVQRVARFDGASWRRVDRSEHAIGVEFDYSQGPAHHVDALVQWHDPVADRDLIVAGGKFDWTDDTPEDGTVVAWTGSRWTKLGSGLTGAVGELKTYVDPSSGTRVLLAVGTLHVASGPTISVAQFDGHDWSSLGTLANLTHVLVAHEPGESGDRLYTIRQPSIYQWDGTSWITIGTVASPTQPFIEDIAYYDDPGSDPSFLYALGHFASVDGVAVLNAARWDGASWSALPAPLPFAGAPDFTIVLRDALNGIDQLVTERGGAGNPDQWSFDGASWTNWGPRPNQIQGAATLLEDDGSGPALYSANGNRWKLGLVEPYIVAPPDPDNRFAIERDAAGAPHALWFLAAESVDGTPARGVSRWGDPCSTLTSYCTAKVSSLGCSAAVGWSGEPSVSATATTPFVITASDVLSNKSGLFFYGVFGRKAQPFQGGTLCLKGPYRRSPVQQSGGSATPDCSGTYALDFSEWIQGLRDPNLDVGVIVDGQWWFRDPPASYAVGFSNAIEFEVEP